MADHFSFFLFSLVTLSATLLPQDEVIFSDDIISLAPTETLDLSINVVDSINESTETIGEQSITLTQEVKFQASDNDVVTLINESLNSVTVEISDTTTVFAPDTWDKTISPPKVILTNGTVASGFQIPTTSIQVGSPDVVLVFDKSVTIILKDIIGQTAYKLPGQTSWTLISTCFGTYDSPIDPPVNGECSINNGIDTKILTFHFTEFTGLTTITSTTPTESSESATIVSSSKSGGGGGRTTATPSSSETHAGKLLPEKTKDSVFPKWFRTSLVVYWVEDLITDDEFKKAMNYMLNKNIIKIDVTEEKNMSLLDLPPSTKELFKLWSSDRLSDSTIIKITTYYRTTGIW